MNSFDGDLVRPLGLVTLYFGYAEAQVNVLVEMLNECGLNIEISPSASLGQRVKVIKTALKKLNYNGVVDTLEILSEAKGLLEQRNLLTHGCVYAKGRVVPNDKAKGEFYVTPESLTQLADKVFNWKERLNSKIQRELLPALRDI
ncbi:hypothetical protein [Methylophilus sp. TWE2]|uniref:hypothetical protein n=1 Tax=Methylophilus sp. TWE2 TaxID=1662285 RepID=UPI000671252E|nr:hypothetical protein [Methylophilus sp. TWE2]AKR42053.1 hypothetical protein ACJ67_00360 [Methylophilus sp. TWE2]